MTDNSDNGQMSGKQDRSETLDRLHKSEFEAVWQIMSNSFPMDERRSRTGQEALLEKPCYRLYGSHTNDRLTAFLAVWEFSDLTFVEHFAVDKSCRNSGLGASLLKIFLEHATVPVVLEVEPPTTSIAQRRIAFYERNGFTLNLYDYIQPPLSDESDPLPLMLMTYPDPIPSEEAFEHIRSILYRHVYARYTRQR